MSEHIKFLLDTIHLWYFGVKLTTGGTVTGEVTVAIIFCHLGSLRLFSPFPWNNRISWHTKFLLDTIRLWYFWSKLFLTAAEKATGEVRVAMGFCNLWMLQAYYDHDYEAKECLSPWNSCLWFFQKQIVFHNWRKGNFRSVAMEYCKFRKFQIILTGDEKN